MSDTVVKQVKERKIIRLNPSTIILENKITKEPRRQSQKVSFAAPKNKSIDKVDLEMTKMVVNQ